MIDEEIKPGYYRVTDILKPFSGYDNIDPEILEKAAARGTFVHDVIAGRYNGLGDPPIPDKWKGYLESFERSPWAKCSPDLIEQRFYCDQIKITGKIDVLFKETLVDFKTSSRPSKTWGPQLAAYVYLLEMGGHKVSDFQIVHLFKDGRNPQIFKYVMGEGSNHYWKIFMSAYDCYRALLT